MIPSAVKSTKAELFAAFEEMRKNYEALQRTMAEPPEQRRKRDEAIVTAVAEHTPVALETEINSFRESIAGYLGEIGHKLAGESTKLTDLRAAIAVETIRLQEVRQVEIAAQTLSLLIAEYDQKKKELEMGLRLAEERLADEMAQKKKQWEREQEEYAYAQKMNRKKEQDAEMMERSKEEAAWREKMAQEAKSFAEREIIITQREAEWQRLETETQAFPARLTVVVTEAEDRVADRLQKEFATEKRLLEQDWHGQRAIFETKIVSLQTANDHLTAEIASLKTALTTANQQAQTLAATVIESVSGLKRAGEEEKLER